MFMAGFATHVLRNPGGRLQSGELIERPRYAICRISPITVSEGAGRAI
jgi:hypothetical protein